MMIEIMRAPINCRSLSFEDQFANESILCHQHISCFHELELSVLSRHFKQTSADFNYVRIALALSIVASHSREWQLVYCVKFTRKRSSVYATGAQCFQHHFTVEGHDRRYNNVVPRSIVVYRGTKIAGFHRGTRISPVYHVQTHATGIKFSFVELKNYTKKNFFMV